MALGVNAVPLIRQAIRAFAPHAKLEVLSTLYSTGQLGGQLLLALGLALAPLATAVVTVRTRYEQALRTRYTNEMHPLWQALTTEFPHIALDTHHSSDKRSTDDDFERISAEITDGLAELARDCPEPNGDPRDPVAAANTVEAALRRRAQARDARWAGDEPEPIEPPYPRLEPDFHGNWRRRAQWMIRLCDELTKRGAIRKELERGTVGELEVPPEQWTGLQAAFAGPVRDCS
ncbi:DUF6545 domain-containing protein [Saccharopolyspora hattusasensis]|uniref:DUF6545 domain-containing protein n=1 Tax=Saccharopolyspora hattusasensis TaxID=1128679 RepID=UPI003D97D5F6